MIFGFVLLRDLNLLVPCSEMYRRWVAYDSGDLFPPGGVLSCGDVICISDGPFEVANRSDGVCTIAGANGA